ncbi:MAG: 2-amino-4-hydroxy-6-hydroxymethyldihydropteridine diphosphokinase [Bacillota bacterium]
MGSRVVIGLGSNMGDKAANIKKALDLLGEKEGITLKGVAPLYKSEPVGYTDQDWFVNTVALFETDLTPRQLLELLMSIEGEMGRVRLIHWGPRIIDLDILLYGDRAINEPDLIIPHPGMGERAFVLAPLADLLPDLVLPGGVKVTDRAALVMKTQRVERYSQQTLPG